MDRTIPRWRLFRKWYTREIIHGYYQQSLPFHIKDIQKMRVIPDAVFYGPFWSKSTAQEVAETLENNHYSAVFK